MMNPYTFFKSFIFIIFLEMDNFFVEFLKGGKEEVFVSVVK